MRSYGLPLGRRVLCVALAIRKYLGFGRLLPRICLIVAAVPSLGKPINVHIVCHVKPRRCGRGASSLGAAAHAGWDGRVPIGMFRRTMMWAGLRRSTSIIRAPITAFNMRAFGTSLTPSSTPSTRTVGGSLHTSSRFVANDAICASRLTSVRHHRHSSNGGGGSSRRNVKTSPVALCKMASYSLPMAVGACTMRRLLTTLTWSIRLPWGTDGSSYATARLTVWHKPLT